MYQPETEGPWSPGIGSCPDPQLFCLPNYSGSNLDVSIWLLECVLNVCPQNTCVEQEERSPASLGLQRMYKHVPNRQDLGEMSEPRFLLIKLDKKVCY